jgi:hypothetical protein
MRRFFLLPGSAARISVAARKNFLRDAVMHLSNIGAGDAEFSAGRGQYILCSIRALSRKTSALSKQCLVVEHYFTER